MFGISPLGWVHILSSLPAIPAAAYMFVRYGRIVPRSAAGVVYFGFMLLGAVSVYPIAHRPASPIIATLTIILLFIGYGVGLLPSRKRAIVYVETITLTLTSFLLMLPTVTEILRRVPDGHPFVTDLQSPLLRGAHLALLLMLVVGLTVQINKLRRQEVKLPA
ncbi:MAG: hypothetical protein ACAI35_24515 [Candidatus Methylacidiphilales bacterium]